MDYSEHDIKYQQKFAIYCGCLTLCGCIEIVTGAIGIAKDCYFVDSVHYMTLYCGIDVFVVGLFVFKWNCDSCAVRLNNCRSCLVILGYVILIILLFIAGFVDITHIADYHDKLEECSNSNITVEEKKSFCSTLANECHMSHVNFSTATIIIDWIFVVAFIILLCKGCRKGGNVLFTKPNKTNPTGISVIS